MAGNRRTTNYLNKEDLVKEIIKSKKRLRESNRPLTPAEALTPELVRMLKKLVERFSQSSNWRNYSYVDDMRCEALLSLCQNALKYDETRFDNPFGYFTQIAKHSFISHTNGEAKQRHIRDDLLQEQDEKPSFTRQFEDEMDSSMRDTHQKVSRVRVPPTEVKRIREDIKRIEDTLKTLASSSEPNAETDKLISEILGRPASTYTAHITEAKKLLPKGYSYSVGTTQEIPGLIQEPAMVLTICGPDSVSKRILKGENPKGLIPIALSTMALALHRTEINRSLRDLMAGIVAVKPFVPEQNALRPVAFVNQVEKRVSKKQPKVKPTTKKGPQAKVLPRNKPKSKAKKTKRR